MIDYYPDKSLYICDNGKWKSAANIFTDCINGKFLSENCKYFLMNASFLYILTVSITLYIGFYKC